MSAFEETLRDELRPHFSRQAFCNLKTDDMVKVVMGLVESALIQTGSVVVPKTASEGLLVSMAMRFDHAFGMNPVLDNGFSMGGMGYTPEQRRSMLTSMKQLHEEVVGIGFYQPDREDRYRQVLNQGGVP